MGEAQDRPGPNGRRRWLAVVVVLVLLATGVAGGLRIRRNLEDPSVAGATQIRQPSEPTVGEPDQQRGRIGRGEGCGIRSLQQCRLPRIATRL